MNALDYLGAAMLLVDSQCADPSRFAEYVRPWFAGRAYSPQAVREGILAFNAEHKTPELVDQTVAARRLVQRDLERVEAALADEVLLARIERESPVEEVVSRTLRQILDLLSQMGFTLEPPNVFFVDSFPEPYARTLFRAINADKGDLDEHGVEPGIYFRKSALRPFHSKLILCHEVIHTILGQKHPELYGRGLEEGLAEVFGGLFLAQQIEEVQVVERVFRDFRLCYSFSQARELYLDATRQVFALYQRFGIDGLRHLLTEGRPRIKSIESLVIKGDIAAVTLPSGEWDERLESTLTRCCLTFPRSLVVSPLAHYLGPLAESGRTLMEIITEAGTVPAAGRLAISELQTRLLSVVLSGDDTVVSWSDAPMLFRAGVVRYELPPDAN